MTLAGLTPAQGLVICLEEDGRASIEFKETSRPCDGCPEDAAAGAELREASDSQAPQAAGACPCVDIEVPGPSDAQALSSRSADTGLETCIAARLEICVLTPSALAAPVRGPPWRTPRVADSLACIRSVILLV